MLIFVDMIIIFLVVGLIFVSIGVVAGLASPTQTLVLMHIMFDASVYLPLMLQIQFTRKKEFTKVFHLESLFLFSFSIFNQSYGVLCDQHIIYID